MEDIPGEKLNQDERAVLERLKHLVTDIERVGDHAVNLAEFALLMEKKSSRSRNMPIKNLKPFLPLYYRIIVLRLKHSRKMITL